MLALVGQPHSLIPMQVDAKYHCISPEAAADVSSEDSAGQALPCLPRRTVVLISGNNRTKKSLVGKQAIVKRCVGLGGWHHCVLQDGTEVKLQRNALSVLEMGPLETQDDPSHGSSSDTEAREPKIEILTQPRIRRPPKGLLPAPDMPLFRKAEASNSSGLRTTTYSLVDLHKLETTSLKRYRRAFQLAEVDAAAPKADLATAVQRHFTTQEVDEDEVLCELAISLRRRYKQQQQRQRLLAQQYACEQQEQYCYSQQQQQQAQYSDDDSTADQQLRQLILLQQQYVYLGPGLFQGQQQQQE